MQEIELKFLIPKSRLKGLIRQAKVKSSQVTQLAAHYYDTPDQKLASAGIGLRIRKEGDAWVQTIKAGGDGIAARLEHNAILDNEQVQAMLVANLLMPDLTIYKETVIAPVLAEFNLKKLAKKLTRLYVTDVLRTTRLLIDDMDDETSNCIEMAYDDGEIIHGNDAGKRATIHEIEFELLSGDLDFLFATAKTWCQRHKLCLSTVTKAERGGLLISGQHFSPAVSANLNELAIDKASSKPGFIRAVVHNCLLHILPNSSAIVAGSIDHGHITELYEGIFRLRCALKTFDQFSDELNPDWLIILKQTATALDDYQKLTYLTQHIEPMLQSHGAPAVDWMTNNKALKIKPIDAIAANDFQLTLLELIAFTMSDPRLEPQADELAANDLTKIVNKRYKKLLKTQENLDDGSSAKTDSMDVEHRATDNNHVDQNQIESLDEQSLNSQDLNAHDLDLQVRDNNQGLYNLCRQLNNLGVISEFIAPLFNNKKVRSKNKRWLNRLKKAQKALNRQLDSTYYQQYYQYKAHSDANALFGAGWLKASLIITEKKTEKQMAKLKSTAIFW